MYSELGYSHLNHISFLSCGNWAGMTVDTASRARRKIIYV